jgi:hypothetical protein
MKDQIRDKSETNNVIIETFESGSPVESPSQYPNQSVVDTKFSSSPLFYFNGSRSVLHLLFPSLHDFPHCHREKCIPFPRAFYRCVLFLFSTSEMADRSRGINKVSIDAGRVMG